MPQRKYQTLYDLQAQCVSRRDTNATGLAAFLLRTARPNVLGGRHSKRAVEGRYGGPKNAKLMQADIRVGGTLDLTTFFRWGYCWPYPRRYKALTGEERKMIKEMMFKK